MTPMSKHVATVGNSLLTGRNFLQCQAQEGRGHLLQQVGDEDTKTGQRHAVEVREGLIISNN